MTHTSYAGLCRLEPVHVATLREELVSLGLWEPIQDSSLTDILIDEDGSVYVQGFDGVRYLDLQVSPEALESCISTIAGLHERVVHSSSPVLEASLPFGGIRVLAILPPVANAPLLALRRPPARLLTLADLETGDTIDSDARARLEQAVEDRRTIVVSGGVGSGKTVLASALLDHLVAVEPDVRLAIIEEGSRELMLRRGANAARLLTRDTPESSPAAILRASLRLAIDRIVVGELRGAEALDWIKAANTGHRGGLTTLHSHGSGDALRRLADLVEEAGVPRSLDRVIRAVDLVVQMSRIRHRRILTEIWQPSAVVGGEVEGRHLYRRDPEIPTKGNRCDA